MCFKSNSRLSGGGENPKVSQERETPTAFHISVAILCGQSRPSLGMDGAWFWNSLEVMVILNSHLQLLNIADTTRVRGSVFLDLFCLESLDKK